MWKTTDTPHPHSDFHTLKNPHQSASTVDGDMEFNEPFASVMVPITVLPVPKLSHHAKILQTPVQKSTLYPPL